MQSPAGMHVPLPRTSHESATPRSPAQGSKSARAMPTSRTSHMGAHGRAAASLRSPAPLSAFSATSRALCHATATSRATLQPARVAGRGEAKSMALGREWGTRALWRHERRAGPAARRASSLKVSETHHACIAPNVISSSRSQVSSRSLYLIHLLILQTCPASSRPLHHCQEFDARKNSMLEDARRGRGLLFIS